MVLPLYDVKDDRYINVTIDHCNNLPRTTSMAPNNSSSEGATLLLGTQQLHTMPPLHRSNALLPENTHDKLKPHEYCLPRK